MFFSRRENSRKRVGSQGWTVSYQPPLGPGVDFGAARSSRSVKGENRSRRGSPITTGDTMRFMMFMYPEIGESEWTPDAEAVAEMGRYNEELRKAGMLLSLDGLHPPGEGARVQFHAEGVKAVTDGPFAEAK